MKSRERKEKGMKVKFRVTGPRPGLEEEWKKKIEEGDDIRRGIAVRFKEDEPIDPIEFLTNYKTACEALLRHELAWVRLRFPDLGIDDINDIPTLPPVCDILADSQD